MTENVMSSDTKLQWEIDWIQNHPEYYHGQWHQQAVIGNVVKRYRISELESKVKAFHANPTTGNMLKLFEIMGLDP